MDDINQFLFPLWNLSPAAPGWLVTLARLSSEYLSKIALAWVFVLLVFGKPAWRRMAIQVLVAIAIVWLVHGRFGGCVGSGSPSSAWDC